jgi:hypothetical protein
VGATEHDYLKQFLEDQVIGYAGIKAAERVVHLSFGQQGTKLFPDEINEVRLDRGYGYTPSPREASTTARMIEHPMPASQMGALHPSYRHKL